LPFRPETRRLTSARPAWPRRKPSSFDSDPTKVVAGLRTDGKKPTAYVADTTTANAQVRTL
jgi:hypothetical protein